MKLFSRMYNVMRKNSNEKLNLLCQITVHSTKKGIIYIYVSVEVIADLYLQGGEHEERNSIALGY